MLEQFVLFSLSLGKRRGMWFGCRGLSNNLAHFLLAQNSQGITADRKEPHIHAVFFNIIHSAKNNLERKGLGLTLHADISTRKQIDLDMIKPEFQERF